MLTEMAPRCHKTGRKKCFSSGNRRTNVNLRAFYAPEAPSWAVALTDSRRSSFAVERCGDNSSIGTSRIASFFSEDGVTSGVLNMCESERENFIVGGRARKDGLGG